MMGQNNQFGPDDIRRMLRVLPQRHPSADLAMRLAARSGAARGRQALAVALVLLPLSALGASWALHFGALTQGV